jgi:hypothetical protein
MPWRCTGCQPVEPPPAPGQAGWAFCALPGAADLAGPLGHPPGWRGWPDEAGGMVHLDTVSPGITSAPLGRCAGCRFTAALSARRRCGACEVKRLLAAGERAVESPDALADPAELTAHGGPPP